MFEILAPTSNITASFFIYFCDILIRKSFVLSPRVILSKYGSPDWPEILISLLPNFTTLLLSLILMLFEKMLNEGIFITLNPFHGKFDYTNSQSFWRNSTWLLISQR